MRPPGRGSKRVERRQGAGVRAPWRGVAGCGSPRLPGRSAGECRKADGGIIADWRYGFQRHVASALRRPFVILFQQDGADEPDDGVLVGEDADHLGPPFDLAVEAFNRVGGVQLGAMGRREAHVGENVSLRFVEEAGEPGQF